jgi:hypothetical protein
MSNALGLLGPVVGNRFADTHVLVLKPHLRQRLTLQACRTTPLGTVMGGPDGRLSFVPNYGQPVPRPAFQPGQRVRVTESVVDLLAQDLYPFEPHEAELVAGAQGIVVERQGSGCAELGLVVVDIAGTPWCFLPAYLARACPAEGDDERAAMADSAPAFDPYSESLALGDTVQGLDGRIGRVTLAEPGRLAVVFNRGGTWMGCIACRSSFRLLAKATATTWGSATGCPF